MEYSTRLREERVHDIAAWLCMRTVIMHYLENSQNRSLHKHFRCSEAFRRNSRSESDLHLRITKDVKRYISMLWKVGKKYNFQKKKSRAENKCSWELFQKKNAVLRTITSPLQHKTKQLKLCVLRGAGRDWNELKMELRGAERNWKVLRGVERNWKGWEELRGGDRSWKMLRGGGRSWKKLGGTERS